MVGLPLRLTILLLHRTEGLLKAEWSGAVAEVSLAGGRAG